MATQNTVELMQQLISGLDALQTDYIRLFEQHTALEHKLAHAREQYNELARLYGKTVVDTPPLSLSSASWSIKNEQSLSADQILNLRDRKHAATQVRAADEAAKQLLTSLGPVDPLSSGGAKHEGKKMPSISESPMEQDFTVAGTPSKLGCPFASMAGKKLSSHAASVLSRYHGSQQDGRASSRDAVSVRRSNSGRAASLSQQNTARRRSSLVDPLKDESCGLDGNITLDQQPQMEMEDSSGNPAEAGVCPIRFLNQHSPEELATYFERHKHELPRSHEICVRRYQSDKEQVKELDARYGNVAQMIRSLGEKHQSFLPHDHEDGANEVDVQSPADDIRIQQWTDAQADMGESRVSNNLGEDEPRQSHFTRSLPEVRVGESPSRPWGIHVPVQHHEFSNSEASSAPVQIKATEEVQTRAAVPEPKASGCPRVGIPADHLRLPATKAYAAPSRTDLHNAQNRTAVDADQKTTSPTTIFNGPLVVGYEPEAAALFLKNLGYLGN